MNQKGFINIIVIALVVLLIGVGGYFVLQQRSSQQPQESFAEQQQVVENNTPEPADNSKETTSNGTQQTPTKQTETVKPTQVASSDISFNVLYPPTPSSFGCNPYAGTYTTQQGKVVQTYDQWKVLYGELLKSCYTKTDAPQIIDFDKQTMIVVFAGSSCAATKADVKTISQKNNKIITHSIVTVGGCGLPSFSYPFTLVAIDKTSLPIEFTFESIKHPNEPF